MQIIDRASKRVDKRQYAIEVCVIGKVGRCPRTVSRLVTVLVVTMFSAASQVTPDQSIQPYEPVSYTHLTLPTNREV